MTTDSPTNRLKKTLRSFRLSHSSIDHLGRLGQLWKLDNTGVIEAALEKCLEEELKTTVAVRVRLSSSGIEQEFIKSGCALNEEVQLRAPIKELSEEERRYLWSCKEDLASAIEKEPVFHLGLGHVKKEATFLGNSQFFCRFEADFLPRTSAEWSALISAHARYWKEGPGFEWLRSFGRYLAEQIQMLKQKGYRGSSSDIIAALLESAVQNTFVDSRDLRIAEVLQCYPQLAEAIAEYDRYNSALANDTND
ncbi:hypothetical protein D3C86_1078660 [compost metagenome]